MAENMDTNQEGIPGATQPVPGPKRFLAQRMGAMLAELVCPLECLWCEELIADAEGGKTPLGFCHECEKQVVQGYHQCRRCASPLPKVVPNETCHRCRKEKWRFDQVVALGPYRDMLSQLVVRLKRPHQDILCRAIGKRMAREFCKREVPSGKDNGADANTLVVPVPNHWTHLFSGAANTAGRLAVQVASELDLPLRSRAVRRIRKTDKQGMLSWTERRQNVRGAFQVGEAQGLKASHVILVDDVLTSGATCGEIASKLKRAGVQRVTVLVAARGVGSKETVLVQNQSETNDG